MEKKKKEKDQPAFPEETIEPLRFEQNDKLIEVLDNAAEKDGPAIKHEFERRLTDKESEKLEKLLAVSPTHALQYIQMDLAIKTRLVTSGKQD